jgi:hypothetical protein
VTKQEYRRQETAGVAFGYAVPRNTRERIQKTGDRIEARKDGMTEKWKNQRKAAKD